MKKKTILMFLAASMLLVSSCKKENKVQLFNGKDLSNWKIVLPDGVPGDSVFRVENNMLYVAGIPTGYIRTRDEYANYKLHVEWRWAAEPKNSGVLLHTTGEDIIFPNSIEAQLMAGNAGDIVLIGKGAGVTVGDSTYLIHSEQNRYKAIPKFNESSENEPGQWNTYEIIAKDDQLELYVNGILQNKATGVTKTRGAITLQSEGGPIQFRNIYIVPLDQE